MKSTIFFKGVRAVMLTGALCLLTSTVCASTLDYSAAQPLAEQTQWGTGRAEIYDVAIKIDNPLFTGSELTSLSLSLPKGLTPEDCKGWLSSRLKNDGTKFTPDIVSAEAELTEGVLRVTFAEGEVMPKEGLYAGFTFTISDIVSDADAQPLLTAPQIGEEGFWIHTSRTYRSWNEKSATLGKGLALTASFTGDFPEASVEVQPGDAFAKVGDEVTLPLTITNFGAATVSEIGYKVSFFDGSVAVGDYTLPAVIPPVWGAVSRGAVAIRLPEQPGQVEITVEVTEVNSISNSATNPRGTAVVDILPFIPVHRPLMEEYTGVWCGYCPKGYVALERMSAMYGEEFVALSYHDAQGHGREPMQCFRTFPNEVSAYPAGIFDRTWSMDPYYGPDYDHGFGIPAVWQDIAAQFTPADISAQLEWDGTMEDEIKVTADVKWAKDTEDSDFRIAYFLAADNLKGPEDTSDPDYGLWLQQNNYADRDEMMGQGADWDLFNNGYVKVPGLVFNDVAVAASPFTGVAGSLPTEIEMGMECSHSYTFKPSELVNIYGQSMLRPGVSLHAVVMIVDGSDHGKVINCARTPNTSYCRMIGNIADGAVPVSDKWYDLSGAEVSAQSKGLLLYCVDMSDGSRRVSKIIRK